MESYNTYSFLTGFFHSYNTFVFMPLYLSIVLSFSLLSCSTFAMKSNGLHSKIEDYGIWFHHFMADRWGKKWKQCQISFSWTPKSLQMVTAALKLKDACSLEGKL